MYRYAVYYVTIYNKHKWIYWEAWHKPFASTCGHGDFLERLYIQLPASLVPVTLLRWVRLHWRRETSNESSSDLCRTGRCIRLHSNCGPMALSVHFACDSNRNIPQHPQTSLSLGGCAYADSITWLMALPRALLLHLENVRCGTGDRRTAWLERSQESGRAGPSSCNSFVHGVQEFYHSSWADPWVSETLLWLRSFRLPSSTHLCFMYKHN